MDRDPEGWCLVLLAETPSGDRQPVAVDAKQKLVTVWAGVVLDAVVLVVPDTEEYAEAAAEFEAVARELNMPQDEAQALVQRMAPKLQQRFAAQQTELMARASSEWAESAKADKEIGGDALPESMAAAKRALKHLGTPELASLLEDSRLGNHPEVLRFMARAGKALGPDGTFLGGRAATNVNAAQSIYAKSNMNP